MRQRWEAGPSPLRRAKGDRGRAQPAPGAEQPRRSPAFTGRGGRQAASG